jgi:hypothetical protein
MYMRFSVFGRPPPGVVHLIRNGHRGIWAEMAGKPAAATGPRPARSAAFFSRSGTFESE